MSKHWFVLLGVALLLAASGLMAVVWSRTEGPVSRARCERVRLGMTRADVEAVLGGPPGDYRSGEVELDRLPIIRVRTASMIRHDWWQGDGGNVSVHFDEEDRVVTCHHWPGRRVTFLDKVRRWLGF